MNTITSNRDGQLVMLKPLRIAWSPKEDITTFELAKAMPFLLCLSRPIMPYEIEAFKGEKFMRHFEIDNPNV